MLAGRRELRGQRSEVETIIPQLNKILCILPSCPLPLTSGLFSSRDEKLDSVGCAADTKDTYIATVALLFS